MGLSLTLGSVFCVLCLPYEEKGGRTETFNKEIENTKKNQSVMKNSIAEIKNRQSMVDQRKQKNESVNWKTE